MGRKMRDTAAAARSRRRLETRSQALPKAASLPEASEQIRISKRADRISRDGTSQGRS